MGIWGALFWKEWLGLRWKMAALAAMPGVLLLFELAYDRQLIPVAFIAGVLSYVAIAPIFLAMHAAAVEHADGTLEFLRGLPCDRRRMGLVRVLATLGALLTPLIGMAALAYGLLLAISHWDPVPLHEFTGPEGTAKAALVGLGVATSIYLWTTALAMNESSELRAGAIGVGTVMVLAVLSFLAISSAERWEHAGWGSRWLDIATGLGPFGSMVAFDATILGPIERVSIVVVQAVISLLLVTVAASRYANLEPWWRGQRKWLSDRTRVLVWRNGGRPFRWAFWQLRRSSRESGFQQGLLISLLWQRVGDRRGRHDVRRRIRAATLRVLAIAPDRSERLVSRQIRGRRPHCARLF